MGSQQVTVQLPAGTTCAGGATKNLCLVSFTTAGGFGNCVVVQKGAAAAGGKKGKNNGRAWVSHHDRYVHMSCTLTTIIGKP